MLVDGLSKFYSRFRSKCAVGCSTLINIETVNSSPPHRSVQNLPIATNFYQLVAHNNYYLKYLCGSRRHKYLQTKKGHEQKFSKESSDVVRSRNKPEPALAFLFVEQCKRMPSNSLFISFYSKIKKNGAKIPKV